MESQFITLEQFCDIHDILYFQSPTHHVEYLSRASILKFAQLHRTCTWSAPVLRKSKINFVTVGDIENMLEEYRPCYGFPFLYFMNPEKAILTYSKNAQFGILFISYHEGCIDVKSRYDPNILDNVITIRVEHKLLIRAILCLLWRHLGEKGDHSREWNWICHHKYDIEIIINNSDLHKIIPDLMVLMDSNPILV